MDKHLTIWLYRRCSFYTIWLHRVHPQHCSGDSVNVRKVRHFALSSLPCGVQHYRRHQKVAVPMEAQKINIIIITQLDWCEFAVILFGEAMQKSATGVN